MFQFFNDTLADLGGWRFLGPTIHREPERGRRPELRVRTVCGSDANPKFYVLVWPFFFACRRYMGKYLADIRGHDKFLRSFESTAR